MRIVLSKFPLAPSMLYYWLERNHSFVVIPDDLALFY